MPELSSESESKSDDLLLTEMNSMSSSFAPDAIRVHLVAILKDENNPVFGQVASVDGSGTPQIRTVHFRYLQNEKTFGFNTHIQSPKWMQLERDRRISGVYFDRASLSQFRWAGSAELVGSEDSNNSDLISEMWAGTPPDVQEAYWKCYQSRSMPIPLHLPCPTFGTVVCRPHLWDVYKMVSSKYADHERNIFTLLDGQWVEERVSTLNVRSLSVP